MPNGSNTLRIHTAPLTKTAERSEPARQRERSSRNDRPGATCAQDPKRSPERGRAPNETAARFEHFLRTQRDALLKFLRRRTRTDEDAKDAAQESFVRLLPYGRTQPTKLWKPLLYRIATNVAHDQSRHAYTHRAANHVPIDGVDLRSSEPSAEHRIAQQQELALIRDAILALPPKCREVYLLNRLEDMTYAEIAAHCSISPKTVEKHIARALVSIREKVGRDVGQKVGKRDAGTF